MGSHRGERISRFAVIYSLAPPALLAPHPHLLAAITPRQEPSNNRLLIQLQRLKVLCGSGGHIRDCGICGHVDRVVLDVIDERLRGYGLEIYGVLGRGSGGFCSGHDCGRGRYFGAYRPSVNKLVLRGEIEGY